MKIHQSLSQRSTRHPCLLDVRGDQIVVLEIELVDAEVNQLSWLVVNERNPQALEREGLVHPRRLIANLGRVGLEALLNSDLGSGSLLLVGGLVPHVVDLLADFVDVVPVAVPPVGSLVLVDGDDLSAFLGELHA